MANDALRRISPTFYEIWGAPDGSGAEAQFFRNGAQPNSTERLALKFYRKREERDHAYRCQQLAAGFRLAAPLGRKVVGIQTLPAGHRKRRWQEVDRVYGFECAMVELPYDYWGSMPFVGPHATEWWPKLNLTPGGRLNERIFEEFEERLDREVRPETGIDFTYDLYEGGNWGYWRGKPVVMDCGPIGASVSEEDWS